METGDAELTPALKELLTRCATDFEFFAEKQLKIANKAGGIELLRLNKAQRYVHQKLEEQLFEQGHIRALILKGRQQGISTYVGARFYHKARWRRGVKVFILTHLAEATDNLFGMVDRYHNNLHPLIRPETSAENAKELKFKRNDSGYKVSTAGSKGTGRSSTIHYFHGSEVAFWPHAKTHAAGVMQAIPTGNNTEIIFESTANGIGGYFHNQWQLAESGKSDFIAIFVPWFWQDEYRLKCPSDFRLSDDEQFYVDAYHLDADQAYWMHKKNIELDGQVGVIGGLFLQEYPFCAADAFQVSGGDKICDTKAIVKARKTVISDKQEGAHILGVDPARFGDDRSSWIHRNRRVAWGLKSFSKISTSELASKVMQEVERCEMAGDPIDCIMIDTVGIGAGVYDMLKDAGFGSIIMSVSGGGTADEPEEYCNKRSEMWDRLNLWLKDEPVSIPDDDSLHGDLIGPNYTYNLKQQKVLESKEQMRKRGVKSPDEGDALAMTFAYAVKKRVARSAGKRKARSWREG